MTLKSIENLTTVGTASIRHGQKLVKALDDWSHMILKFRIGKTLKTSENSQFFENDQGALTIKLLKLPKSHSKTPKSLEIKPTVATVSIPFFSFRELREFYNFFPAHQIPR